MASPLIALLEDDEISPTPRAGGFPLNIELPGNTPINVELFQQDIVPVKRIPKPKPIVRQRLNLPNHTTKPCFEPVGESLFGEYLGVELELEVGGKNFKFRDEIAYEINTILNSDDKKYCLLKKDGSLDCGFEICTRPCSLEHHRAVWTNFFNNLPPGLIASPKCGIHIHTSKDAMSRLQIGKILNFIHGPKNRKFVQLVAQRGSLKHCDFNMHKTMKHALPQYLGHFHHYSPVNLLNPNTVEFRMFASTTDLAEFLKNLEFCHALVKFTFPGVASIKAAANVNEFILFVKKHRLFYPNLVNFLSKKGYGKVLVEVKDAKLHRKVR